MTRKKVIAIFLITSIFVFGFSLKPILAKDFGITSGVFDRLTGKLGELKDNLVKLSDIEIPEVPEIPEIEGIYDVPQHPEMKVRVFVFKAKTDAVSSPSLVCGLSDPGSSSLVGALGWHLPEGSWKYQLNPNSAPSKVGSANLAVMAKDAFARWSDASGNKVSFSQGSNTTVSRAAYDKKNIIAWGTASASALAVTYTWYYPSTGLVAEVDTIMNKKFTWSWTPYNAQNLCAVQNSYDAQDILTHELGHWLGLADHYTADYKDSTMYGYGSKAEIKKETLTAGDIAGAEAIY